MCKNNHQNIFMQRSLGLNKPKMNTFSSCWLNNVSSFPIYSGKGDYCTKYMGEAKK